MPKIGQERVTARHGTGTRHLGDGHEPVICTHLYDIYVNTAGQFYATLPDFLEEAGFTQEAKRSNRSSKVQVFDPTLNGLRGKLHTIHEAYLNPEVKEYPVIRFVIKSEVVFAETPDGRIVPNCNYAKDAKWPSDDRRYGKIYSASQTFEGYSLTIGAKAQMKTVRTYSNDKIVVSYSDWDGGEGHHHHEPQHPAARLNSWNRIKVDRFSGSREIKYSDEAAIFFYGLLHGMAEIARRIQEHTFHNENLLKLIDSQVKLLTVGDKS